MQRTFSALHPPSVRDLPYCRGRLIRAPPAPGSVLKYLLPGCHFAGHTLITVLRHKLGCLNTSGTARPHSCPHFPRLPRRQQSSFRIPDKASSFSHSVSLLSSHRNPWPDCPWIRQHGIPFDFSVWSLDASCAMPCGQNGCRRIRCISRSRLT